MRTCLLVSSLLTFMVSGTVAAQSIEESYAKLCSDPAKAKSETCQALGKSLMAKLQGQQLSAAPVATSPVTAPASEALWRKRWGVLYDMAGKELIALMTHQPGTTPEQKLMSLNFRSKMEWKVPGEVMVTRFRGVDGTWSELSTTHWKEATQQLVNTAAPPSGFVSRMVVHGDGAVEGLEATVSGTAVRSMTRRTLDGVYETVSETKKGGAWTHLMTGQVVEYSPERLAIEQQKIYAGQRAAQQHLADQAQQARDEKRANSEQRAAMFNSVIQGLAEGSAGASGGGYAEAQANLDATVAGIQAAAAVERQQQAAFAQQSSARPASSQGGSFQQPQYAAVSNPAPQSSPVASSPSTQTATSPAASAAPAPAAGGKPLRFVMIMSMRNLPGDRVNSTCYSNTVTRDGPPGWGERGFLPPGSGEKARAAVEALKAQFIAACQASGRQITSAGNFNWVWNQTQSDEDRLVSERPKHPEDVSVTIH